MGQVAAAMQFRFLVLQLAWFVAWSNAPELSRFAFRDPELRMLVALTLVLPTPLIPFPSGRGLFCSSSPVLGSQTSEGF